MLKSAILTFVLTAFLFSAFSLSNEIYVVGEPSLTFNTGVDSNDFGEANGPDVELFRALFSEMDIKATFDVLPWTVAYDMTLSDSNTMIIGIVRSEHREKLFQWVEVFKTVEHYLYSYGAKPRFSINSDKDLKTLKIGTQYGDVLSHALSKMNLDEVLHVPDQLVLLTMLEQGGLELMTSSRDYINYLCQLRDNCSKLHPEYRFENAGGDLYFAFNKDADPKLISDIRAAYQQFVVSGRLNKIVGTRDVVLQYQR